MRALDYAVANGARVINMSLGGDGRLGTAFEAALLRATNAGIVVVASSGNDSEDNPGWPARYAVDSRYGGRVIAVGSHTAQDVMSDFSNKAGVAAAGYLSAPGSDIITGCDGSICYRANGTSFSAPHVSGAVALLLDAFPNLTGQQAVRILFDTARDAGDPGTDVVYGRGLMDLTRAFQPVGATATPTASGASVVAEANPGSFVGAAFGDAFGRQGALTTVAYDAYDRLFQVQLGSAYPTAPRPSVQPRPYEPSQQATVSLVGPGSVRLNLVAAQPMPTPEPIMPRRNLLETPWRDDDVRREAMVGIEAGRLQLNVWQGEGGAASPFGDGAGDGFAALAQADRAVQGGVRLGLGLSLSAEAGMGDRRMPLQRVEDEASSYSRAMLAWRGRTSGVSLGLGGLDERLGPLGAWMPSTSDMALPSRTRFYALAGDWAVSPRVGLFGEASLGRTEIEGRLIGTDGAATSLAWRFGAAAGCKGWSLLCDRVTLSLGQPLRIEHGELTALLADVPLDYFDPLTFSQRRFSAAPSGRQIDLTVAGERRLADGSTVTVQGIASREPQHIAGAKPGFSLIGAWRRAF